METDISAPDLSYASAEAVRRQSRLLRLLEAVAVSADEAASVEEAVRTCLDQVCLHTGLCAGYAYFPSGSQEGEPVAAGLCRVEGPFAGAHPCLEPLGLELAAGVLETGKPAWIELESPGNTRGAFAFPVLAGREVLAALVLFSPSIAEPDRELGEAMARVGAHLGRVVERLRAAAALQETTERARLVIEAAADAFVSVDASDTITGLNHAAEMTFGWPREEAIGRTVADLIIAPAHRSRYRSDLAHYLGTGREPASLVTGLMAPHPDGREVPIRVAIWPVRSGSGWQLHAVARDISARNP